MILQPAFNTVMPIVTASEVQNKTTKNVYVYLEK
jgi:hypothetical protein